MKDFIIGLLIMLSVAFVSMICGASDFLAGAFSGGVLVYWLFRKKIFLKDQNFKKT